MADIQTYLGATPKSCPLGASAVARGLRIVRGSDGLYTVAGVGVRGDFVTLRDAVASEVTAGCPSGTPASVPAVASEAITDGDLAYSAALGKFSKTSTNAVLMGRWSGAVSGDGVLGTVQLFPVA